MKQLMNLEKRRQIRRKFALFVVVKSPWMQKLANIVGIKLAEKEKCYDNNGQEISDYKNKIICIMNLQKQT